MEDLYGHALSDAVVTLETATAPVHAAVKAHLIHTAESIHCDETGIRIAGQLAWVHVTSTARVTYLEVHAQRGKEALDAIDILPQRTGRVIHDGYKSYEKYADLLHGGCNAYHLRDLLFIDEQHHQAWASGLVKVLVEAKAAVDEAKEPGLAALSKLQRGDFDRRYDELLAQGLLANPPPPDPPEKKRGRKKQSKAKNLSDRLQAHKPEVLAFMYDFNDGF